MKVAAATTLSLLAVPALISTFTDGFLPPSTRSIFRKTSRHAMAPEETPWSASELQTKRQHLDRLFTLQEHFKPSDFQSMQDELQQLPPSTWKASMQKVTHMPLNAQGINAMHPLLQVETAYEQKVKQVMDSIVHPHQLPLVCAHWLQWFRLHAAWYGQEHPPLEPQLQSWAALLQLELASHVALQLKST